MWRLIFSFLMFLNIWQFIYPFLIKFDIKCNILRLKGVIFIKFFNKIKIEFKFRIKNGYIYFYFKNKEKKEMIYDKNFSFILLINIIKQLYFRHQLLSCQLISNFGYTHDAMITASCAGVIDVLTKSIFAKVKNNKKSSHIFIDVNPKYNEDVFNLRLIDEMRISVFDIIFTLIYAIIRSICKKIKMAKTS